jgi:hypothetical protein
LSCFDCGGGGCGLVVPAGKSVLFTAGGEISLTSNGSDDCFLGGETVIGLEAGFVCALTTFRGGGVLWLLVIPFLIPSSLQRATRIINHQIIMEIH